MEADQSVAVVLYFDDLAGHRAALERERGADLCTLARTLQVLPIRRHRNFSEAKIQRVRRSRF